MRGWRNVEKIVLVILVITGERKRNEKIIIVIVVIANEGLS